MTTGEQIKSARKAIGLTQKKLAIMVSMEAGDISKLENDLRNPAESTIKKISDALGVDIIIECERK